MKNRIAALACLSALLAVPRPAEAQFPSTLCVPGSLGTECITVHDIMWGDVVGSETTNTAYSLRIRYTSLFVDPIYLFWLQSWTGLGSLFDGAQYHVAENGYNDTTYPKWNPTAWGAPGGTILPFAMAYSLPGESDPEGDVACAFPIMGENPYETCEEGPHQPDPLVTPEPTTILLLATGLLGLGGVGLVRRRQGQA